LQEAPELEGEAHVPREPSRDAADSTAPRDWQQSLLTGAEPPHPCASIAGAEPGTTEGKHMGLPQHLHATKKENTSNENDSPIQFPLTKIRGTCLLHLEFSSYSLKHQETITHSTLKRHNFE